MYAMFYEKLSRAIRRCILYCKHGNKYVETVSKTLCFVDSRNKENNPRA